MKNDYYPSMQWLRQLLLFHVHFLEGSGDLQVSTDYVDICAKPHHL